MINFKKYKYGFTLVELVIAIAVILVLVTVAFLMFSKWISNSRDSRRVTDIATLEKSLELGFTTNPSGLFPFPDNGIQVNNELDGKLWIQGTYGEEVRKELNNIDKIPVDPLGKQYEYSVTYDRHFFQVMALLENGSYLSNFVNKTYANINNISYIKGYYNGYIISKNLDKTYTLISSPTLFVSSKFLNNNENNIYKTKLINEIVDKNKRIDKTALILTGDVTTFFTRDEDTQTMQMVEEFFPGILQDGMLHNLITNAGGNVSTLIVKSACMSGEYLGFQFGRLKNGEFQIATKSTEIQNGIIQDNMKGTCNNGSYVFGSIQTNKICNDSYVLYNENCVLDICDGQVPQFGELNGTQKVGVNRDYSDAPGICKFKCVDGYHFENGLCIDNIKIVNCGGVIMENSINNSSGSVTYNQIWNGTYYDPMYLDWEYNETPGECKFICDTSNVNMTDRYYWNGEECIFLGTPNISFVSKSDTSITIKWNKVTDADSYAVKSGQGNWNVIGNLTGYIFEGLTPGSSYEFNVIAIKNYNGNTIHSNIQGVLQQKTNCAPGFHFEGEQCVTNNCNSITKILGDHQYILPSITDGNIFTGSSQPVSIDNGTIIYNQTFQCNLGTVVEVGLETYQTPVCNSGYSPSSNGCVINTYSISGSFGVNGSGALVSICGFESIANSSGVFAISAIPEGTNCNNAIVSRPNYTCTVSNNGPSSIVSNITNVSGSCSLERIWTGNAVNGFTFSEGGIIKYPKSCNDLLVSSNPSFKYGSNSPWNGTKFIDGNYFIEIVTGSHFLAYCDMTTNGGGRTAIVKDYNTTVSDLQNFGNTSYISATFYSDATYGIGWGTNNYYYKTYVIDSNLVFSNMRIKYTGRYDGTGLGDFKIATLNGLNGYYWGQSVPDQGQSLLGLADANTDIDRGQSLSVNGVSIFSSSKTNVFNREDTLNGYGRFITMTGFTSGYPYNKRYIGYLYVR